MNRRHIIYMITNLLNNMIYVGKHSTTTPHDMKGYWSSSPYLKNTIKKYNKENFKRETLFIFETENEAYVKEEEIVDQAFVDREDTYNQKVGGKGCKSGSRHPWYGHCHSEETKKLLSINHWDSSGVNSPWYGKHLSAEHKEKIGDYHRNKVVSEETREKCRIGNLKYFASPKGKKAREEISKFRTGRKCTEETKKKMSESRTGKHHSKETKQKISENNVGMLGKCHSEETKKKMSDNSPMKLSSEIIKQRREDIKNEPKTWGWKARLSEKWGISHCGVRAFISKYALDLVE